MMKFPIYGKVENKKLFQTTKQYFLFKQHGTPGSSHPIIFPNGSIKKKKNYKSLSYESWINMEYIPFCKQIAIIYHRYGNKT